MKKYDVVAVGELLVDLIQNGYSAQGNPLYEANPGGAPCNVLAMLQKLGHTTAFIGKIGKDAFGNQLKRALGEVGIATEALISDEVNPTTLAVVHTKEDGDREFSFYRKAGADSMLLQEEVQEELIKNAKIFHFGSVSLTNQPTRSATKKAVAIAEKAGCLISYDPNLRKLLWENEMVAKEEIQYGMRHCHILKISDDELQWLMNEADCEKAMQRLRDEFPIPMVFLTLGKKGSKAYLGNLCVEQEGFLQKATIETTGAGDTFMGCILHFILERGYNKIGESDLKAMLQFANAAASIITTRKGALRVMPSENEIAQIINRR